MKNKKIAKISLLVLALALCLVTVFAVISLANDAGDSANQETTETKKPEIFSKNIEYTDKFAIMYAVDASTVVAPAQEGDSPIKLYLYDKDPKNGGAPIKIYDESTKKYIEKLEAEAYIFTTVGISALNFTSPFYAIVEDSAGNKSEPIRYSVAEYLYERLSTRASGDVSDAQYELYRGAIEMGTGVQMTMGNKLPANSPELISNLRYVVVNNGTVEGYSTGVYPIGEKLPLDPVTITTGESKLTKLSITSYNDAASATRLTLEGTTVDDADKMVVDCSTIEYTPNVQTFTGKTGENDAVEGITRVSTTQTIDSTIKYAPNDTDATDTVLSATFNATNNYISFNNLDAELSYHRLAAAFELSFDIKIDFSDTLDGYQHLTYRIDPYGGNFSYRLGFVNNNGKLRLFVNDGSGSATGTYYDTGLDFKDNAWMKVRMYILKDKPSTMYCFIDDLDIPIEMDLKQEYDISKITSWKLGSSSTWIDNAAGTNVQIDNMFFGYIDEEEIKINYNIGTETFDNINGTLADNGITSTDTTLGIVEKYPGSTDKVLSLDLTKDKPIEFTHINEEVSIKEIATAFEVSYDLKMTFVYNEKNNGAITHRFTPPATSPWNHRHAIYIDGNVLRFTTEGVGTTKTDVRLFSDQWIHLRMVIYEKDSSNMYYYIDGSDTPIAIVALGEEYDITKITNYTLGWGTYGNHTSANIQIDNFFCGYIDPVVETDADKVVVDKEALEIENLEAYSSSTVVLPTSVVGGQGSIITWTVAEADAAKATLNGADLTFAACTKNQTVKVTATIKSGEVTDTKDFTFNVIPSDKDKLDADVAALTLTNLNAYCGNDTALPATGAAGSTIIWAVAAGDTSGADIKNNNTLTTPDSYVNIYLNLVATIQNGAETATKEFAITVTGNKVPVVDYTSTTGMNTFDDKTLGEVTDVTCLATGDQSFNANMQYVVRNGDNKALSATFYNPNNFISFADISKDVAQKYSANAFEISFDIKIDTTNVTNSPKDSFYIISKILPGNGASTYSDRLEIYNAGTSGSTLQLRNYSNGDIKNTGINFVNNQWMNLRMVVYKDDPTAMHYYITVGENTYSFTLDLGESWDIKAITEYRLGFVSAYSNPNGLNVQIDNMFFGYTQKDKTYDSYVNDLSKFTAGDTEHYVNQWAGRDDASKTDGDTNFFTNNNTTYYKYVNDGVEHGTVASILTVAEKPTTSPRFAILNNYTLPEGTTATAYQCSFDVKVTLDGTGLSDDIVTIRPMLLSGTSTLNDLPYFYITSSYNKAGDNKIRLDNSVYDGIDSLDWMHIRYVVYKSDPATCHIYVNEEAHFTFATKITTDTFSTITSAGMLYYAGSDENAHISGMYVDNIFAGFTTDTPPAN